MSKAPNMPVPPDPQWRAFTYFWRGYRSVIENLERSLSGGPLSLVEYQVLFHLSKAEGNRIRFVHLANSLLLSHSRVSKLMDNLVAKGFVQREITAKDRRATFANLTPIGAQAFTDTTPLFLAAFSEHFGQHLSESDAVEFQGILSRFIDSEGHD